MEGGEPAIEKDEGFLGSVTISEAGLTNCICRGRGHEGGLKGFSLRGLESRVIYWEYDE